MRVLEIASEAVPFAKTGGLSDVARALPEALAELGCDVTLMVPAYAEALGKGLPIEPAGIELDVPIGTGSRRARIQVQPTATARPPCIMRASRAAPRWWPC